MKIIHIMNPSVWPLNVNYILFLNKMLVNPIQAISFFPARITGPRGGLGGHRFMFLSMTP